MNLGYKLLEAYKSILEEQGYMIVHKDPRLPRIKEAYDTGYVFEGTGEDHCQLPTFEEAKIIVTDETLQCMQYSEYLKWRAKL